jgi:hypothetical protein
MPIGILLSAHSNTRIEAFTQREAIEAHPKLKGDADLMRNADPLTEQGRKKYEQYYTELSQWQDAAGEAMEKGGRVPARPKSAGYRRHVARAVTVFQRQDCAGDSLCHSRRDLVPGHE